VAPFSAPSSCSASSSGFVEGGSSCSGGSSGSSVVVEGEGLRDEVTGRRDSSVEGSEGGFGVDEGSGRTAKSVGSAGHGNSVPICRLATSNLNDPDTSLSPLIEEFSASMLTMK